MHVLALAKEEGTHKMSWPLLIVVCFRVCWSSPRFYFVFFFSAAVPAGPLLLEGVTLSLFLSSLCVCVIARAKKSL